MATPEEQTLEASATGMTNFADKRPDVSKNIQTAGLGKEIFGLFGEILNRQSKGGMGTGVSGSDVTTKVCPCSSKNFLKPNSPETHPSNSPGLKSIAFGVGRVIPSGYFSIFGILSNAYFSGIPLVGSSYKTHNIFICSICTKLLKKGNI